MMINMILTRVEGYRWLLNLLIISAFFSSAYDTALAQRNPANNIVWDVPQLATFYRISDHTVEVSVDYAKVDPIKWVGGAIKATLRPVSPVWWLNGTQETVLASAAAATFPKRLDKVPISGNLSLGNNNRYDGVRILELPLNEVLPDGFYKIKVELKDAAGKIYNYDLSLNRAKNVWEDNGIGITNKIIAPWTPLTVEGRTAKCWGRTYTFGQLGLPATILSLQPEPAHGAAEKQLLSEPVQLVIEGKDGSITLTGQPPVVKLRNETAVDVTASASSDQLTATVNGTLEFDGFYKFHLTLSPKDVPVSLTSVRLEVVLPNDIVRLVNASAEDMRTNKAFADVEKKGDGELWNSVTMRAVYTPDDTYRLEKANRMVVGNFVPHVWFGDDDRGIAFMGDNDRGWLLDYNKPCMDIVRRNGKTILRLHLVNTPSFLSKPLETTLSLQATPIKPRQPGESWKQFIPYGWGHFDEPILYAGCFSAYDQGKLPERGKAPYGGASGPNYANEQAKQDNRWWRYFCFFSDRIVEGDPEYGQWVNLDSNPSFAEWRVSGLAWWNTGFHTPSNSDFRLWAYQQWHDRAKMSGIYFDNTMASPVQALGNGYTWEDEQGIVHPSFGMFGAREFMKRVQTYFLSVGPAPVTNVHMSDAPLIGYLGFADFWMDGENDGYVTERIRNVDKNQTDFVDRWVSPIGLANLRTTLGRQWGVLPYYLYYWGGSDPTYSVLGQFDLNKGYRRIVGIPFTFNETATDCHFIPFWDDRHPAQVEPAQAEMPVGVWTRPGQVRLLISNFSANDQTVSVRVDTRLLGMPANSVAVDEQSGKSLDYRNGMVRNLAVVTHGYRVVLLAAPGVFTPVETAPARTLLPDRATWITRLCDDFATLSPEWNFNCSTSMNTNQWAEDHWWHQLYGGQLRFSGGLGAHTVAVRPFNEDNCTVQCSVRVDGEWYIIGPHLALWWGKDKYVQIIAGNSRGPSIFQVKTAGNTQPFKSALTNPLQTGTINWVKIALQPNVINCYGCVDGKTWMLLGTIPRQGLEGAPTHLILGNGMAGPADFLANDSAPGYGNEWKARDYFDDLITAR